VSTLSAAVDLPVTDHTVRDARVLVLDMAASWGAAASRIDLALLVDDLTEDVVARAGAENALRLEVRLDDELLRVSIADGSAVRPVAAEMASAVAPPSLLATLASRWGEEPHHGGHRIWFELTPATDPASPPDDLDAPPIAIAQLHEALGLAPPAPESTIEALRGVARSVLNNIDQLRRAGLARAAEATVVGPAMSLALGIDYHEVTDARASWHALQLRRALAVIEGPLAAGLVDALDDALDGRRPRG
jgi:hypothetical protein